MPATTLRLPLRTLLQAVFLAAVLVLTSALLTVGVASAAAAPVVQCNDLANVGGQGVDCEVTVTNTYNAATATGTSTVTVRACTGATGAVTTCTS